MAEAAQLKAIAVLQSEQGSEITDVGTNNDVCFEMRATNDNDDSWVLSLEVLKQLSSMSLVPQVRTGSKPRYPHCQR